MQAFDSGARSIWRAGTERPAVTQRVIWWGDMGNSSPDELRTVEARLLREAWGKAFGKTRGRRKQLAEKYGKHESYVGQMLNGYTPISALWKRRLAQYLSMDPKEIWPDFDVHEAIAEQLPEPVAELLREALKADPERVRAVTTLLKSSSSAT